MSTFYQPTAGNTHALTGSWSQYHYIIAGPDGAGNWHFRRNDESNYTHGLYYEPATGDLSSHLSWNSGSPLKLSLGQYGTYTNRINPTVGQTIYASSNTDSTGFIFSMSMTPDASGPTVTSITDDTIFVPSDTVSNTDFTLLKNGSAYANTNISLTGPGAQPPSDARGYTYTLTYDGDGYYDVTIDSKTFFGYYYDDSWTSSPTSGRNPLSSSSRILNIIATIPSLAIFQTVDNVKTAHLGTLSNNGRVLTYVKSIYVSGAQTHNLTVKFWVTQKTINGSQEIVGTFGSKIEQYPPAIDGRSFATFDYIIGAQQKMSHTVIWAEKTYVFEIMDWVYSAEPEGDGYVAPVSTQTSHGGGRPDRYPIIMTNLFNRNRSIYSIGMTHKDTWDLFL